MRGDPAPMTLPKLPRGRIAPYVRVLAWSLLAPGAMTTLADSGPDRIGVEPAAIRLGGAAARQQVAVTGHYADGSVRDLTAEARFAVEPSGVLAVSAGGVVT